MSNINFHILSPKSVETGFRVSQKSLKAETRHPQASVSSEIVEGKIKAKTISDVIRSQPLWLIQALNGIPIKGQVPENLTHEADLTMKQYDAYKKRSENKGNEAPQNKFSLRRAVKKLAGF